MKWTLHSFPRTERDPAFAYQDAVLQTSVPGIAFDFQVFRERRCWVATVSAYGVGSDTKLGEYRDERLAKAACRRKAGRIVDALKRGIRA